MQKQPKTASTANLTKQVSLKAVSSRPSSNLASRLLQKRHSQQPEESGKVKGSLREILMRQLQTGENDLNSQKQTKLQPNQLNQSTQHIINIPQLKSATAFSGGLQQITTDPSNVHIYSSLGNLGIKTERAKASSPMGLAFNIQNQSKVIQNSNPFSNLSYQNQRLQSQLSNSKQQIPPKPQQQIPLSHSYFNSKRRSAVVESFQLKSKPLFQSQDPSPTSTHVHRTIDQKHYSTNQVTSSRDIRPASQLAKAKTPLGSTSNLLQQYSTLQAHLKQTQSRVIKEFKRPYTCLQTTHNSRQASKSKSQRHILNVPNQKSKESRQHELKGIQILSDEESRDSEQDIEESQSGLNLIININTQKRRINTHIEDNIDQSRGSHPKLEKLNAFSSNREDDELLKSNQIQGNQDCEEIAQNYCNKEMNEYLNQEFNYSMSRSFIRNYEDDYNSNKLNNYETSNSQMQGRKLQFYDSSNYNSRVIPEKSQKSSGQREIESQEKIHVAQVSPKKKQLLNSFDRKSKENLIEIINAADGPSSELNFLIAGASEYQTSRWCTNVLAQEHSDKNRTQTLAEYFEVIQKSKGDDGGALLTQMRDNYESLVQVQSKNKPLPTVFNNFRDNKSYLNSEDVYSTNLSLNTQLNKGIIKQAAELEVLKRSQSSSQNDSSTILEIRSKQRSLPFNKQSMDEGAFFQDELESRAQTLNRQIDCKDNFSRMSREPVSSRLASRNVDLDIIKDQDSFKVLSTFGHSNEQSLQKTTSIDNCTKTISIPKLSQYQQETTLSQDKPHDNNLRNISSTNAKTISGKERQQILTAMAISPKINRLQMLQIDKKEFQEDPNADSFKIKFPHCRNYSMTNTTEISVDSEVRPSQEVKPSQNRDSIYPVILDDTLKLTSALKELDFSPKIEVKIECKRVALDLSDHMQEQKRKRNQITTEKRPLASVVADLRTTQNDISEDDEVLSEQQEDCIIKNRKLPSYHQKIVLREYGMYQGSSLADPDSSYVSLVAQDQEVEEEKNLSQDNSVEEEVQVIKADSIRKCEVQQTLLAQKESKIIDAINHIRIQQSLIRQQELGNQNQESIYSSINSSQLAEAISLEQRSVENVTHSVVQEQFILNLENVLAVENKVHEILQRLNKPCIEYHISIVDLCEDWWELARKESSCLFEIDKLYRDERLRQNIRQSMVTQLLSISILGFIISQHEQMCIINQLRNLMLNQHLSFMLVLQLIKDRFPENVLNENMWSLKLQEIINDRLKSQQMYKEKIQRISQMTNLNKVIENTLHGLLEKCEIEKVKSNKSARQEIFSHPLLGASRQAMRNIKLMTFQDVKQLIGRSLRSDYSLIEKSLMDEASRVQNNFLSSEDADSVSDELDQGVEVDRSAHLEPAPYIISPRRQKLYTLILDLDETLIHYHENEEEDEEELRIRPGADEFLARMSKHYEIVIFTAAVQDYADWAISHLENEHFISHRLYRQHALPLLHPVISQQMNSDIGDSSSGVVLHNLYIKDLSRIGRELERMIIVDNIAENFQLQPENGIFIKTWMEDPRDTALYELAPLLEAIAESRVNDVREGLRIFRQYMMEQMAAGIQNPTQQLASNIAHLMKKSVNERIQ